MSELTAKEMENQMNAHIRVFEEHMKEEQKEILDEIDSDIKELTRISKEDDLGF